MLELSGKVAPRFGLTHERILAFQSELTKYTEFGRSVSEEFVYARDPDDAHYVNLAHTAGAEFLVSRDRDLLDLMADTTFRGQYPTLRILSPPGFLAELG